MREFVIAYFIKVESIDSFITAYIAKRLAVYLQNVSTPFPASHLPLFIKILIYDTLLIIPTLILKLMRREDNLVSIFLYILLTVFFGSIILTFYGFFVLLFQSF